MTTFTDAVTRLRAAGCVFAEEEATHLLAAATTPEALESMLTRRAAGVPLEHVLGFADFAGVRLAVGEGVFVPRHRTELLTTVGRALVRPGSTVLDLCCGTGALGLVVARDIPRVRLLATDIDPAATTYARANLAPLTDEVFTGDLFAPLPPALHHRIDVLLANVPYVPTAEISFLPEEFRLHESRTALDGGPDGLTILRRVAAEARLWLAPTGALLTETATPQLDAAHAVLRAAGLDPATITDEDTETHVIAARPTP
jgi:release factor glutamine methyltransferase